RAHLAHATMISLHALCCGMPILAMALVAMSGAATSATLFAVTAGEVHGAIHAHEPLILLGSALLVSVGGFFEYSSRCGGHKHGFPWLFALSVACFVFNFAIIAAHRL